MANTAGDEATGFGTPLVNGFEGIGDAALPLLILGLSENLLGYLWENRFKRGDNAGMAGEVAKGALKWS